LPEFNLRSSFYNITYSNHFKTTFHSFFKKKEYHLEDIQDTFIRLDEIFKDCKRWKNPIENLFVFKKETKRGNLIAKIYLPITKENISKKKGTRLLIVIKQRENEIELCHISPKNKIASGSKNDFPPEIYSCLEKEF